MLVVNVIRMFLDMIDPDELFDLLILILFIPITLCVALIDIIISPFELLALIIYGIRRIK